MNDIIFEFESPWDKSILLKECDKSKLQTFSNLNKKWQKSFDLGEYGKSILNEFEGNVAAGYYYQPKNTGIKPHRDTGCKTRINLVLLGNEQTLYIHNQSYVYDCALINVNKYEHYLKESKEDRLLFSIIYLDHSFEQVCRIIKGHIKD